jgi:small subunit ribosomal protein S5
MINENDSESSEKLKNTNRIRRSKKSNSKSIRWEQRVVQVQRVAKVVKGGKKLSFRATVIVGNQNSQVGVGVAKADEVSSAVKKAINDARKNLIQIPLTKGETIPHIVTGIDGASKVFIRPAGLGTGVIAGSSIRMILELAGVRNILAKQLGSKNLLNNARATINALKSLKTTQQVANERNITIEQLYQ